MGFIRNIFNFDNIGYKIKSVTKWVCWVSILLIWITAPIAFVGLMADDSTFEICWIPLAVAIVYPFIIWLASWPMYAFGETVEKISDSAENSERIVNKLGKSNGEINNTNSNYSQNKKNNKHSEIQDTTNNSVKNNIKPTSSQSSNTSSKKHLKNVKKEFSVSVSGKGYVCPICNITNYNFSVCSQCGYDPNALEDSNDNSDLDYTDVNCPNCGEAVAVLGDEKSIICPWCDKKFDLKS